MIPRFYGLFTLFLCWVTCLLSLTGRARAIATSYPLSNSAFILSGAWSAQMDSGHGCQRNDKYSDEVDFLFTGTALDMLCRINTTITLAYKIDGGTWATLPNTAGAWTTINVVSGLADRQHSIVIKDITGNATVWYIDSAAGFTVTGASPTVANPPNLNNSTIYYVADSSPASHVVLEGGDWINVGSENTSNSYTLNCSTQYSGLDAGIRFFGKFSELWAYVTTTYPSTLNLRVADTPVGATNVTSSLPSTSYVAEWVKVAGGGSLYYPVECTLSVGQVYPYVRIMAISLVGGGAEFSTWTPTTKKYLVTYGDSFTQATAVSNTALGYSNVLAQMLGLAIWQRGVSGVTVRNYSSTSGFLGPTPQLTTLSLEARTADIASLSPAPPYVVVMGGTNDLYQSTENHTGSGITIGADGSGANFTPSQFQTSYANVLTAIHTAYPSSLILCPSIIPKSNDTSVLVGGHTQAYWRGLLNAAMKAACNSMAGVRYLNAEAWLTQPDDFCEGWHPNASGYRKIAINLYNATLTSGGTKRKLQ